MASAATPTTAGSTLFNQVLDDFKRDLSQKEVNDFSFASSVDLKTEILRLQAEQKSEKRMQNLSRLSAFVEAMDQFDKVMHVFLNTANYLGFIWGPAKFMLLIASSHSEALNTLLDTYQEIGEHIPALEHCESHISNNSYVQEVVGMLYKDILTFHRKALKHFRQRAWKKLFHATWRTFRTDFDAIISNLKRHQGLLDSRLIFSSIQETMKVVNEIHETRRILEEECRKRQDEERGRQQLAVISWLSAADSSGDHEHALSVYEDDLQSGQWLFQEDAIKNWVDRTSSSEPLLWINGKPGAGKTILASNLIEVCRRQPNATVVYFYCKHGDSSRDNFMGLARSIISQFTKFNPLLVPYILEVQSNAGTNLLRSPKIAKEILNTSIESFHNLVLVVDGLDECIKSQKDEIVSWIRSEVIVAEDNGSQNLRSCFLSQHDNDTGRLLRGLPSFKITNDHNRTEILRFCQRRATRIGEDFGLSPHGVRDLVASVAENADGMFLYSKLVMDNLEGQVSRAALKQELKQIPPNLDQVYIRIRHRILEESSLAERSVAKTLLSWILCAKRPLKWHEIQGAMSLDLDLGLFDDQRRLIREIKHFCGSLVEVHNGGEICLVHLTARYFLQNEPALPAKLEHINFTRLCFSQLSLASHAFDTAQDYIEECIFRGEYAFTEYAVLYGFDHLLDVLSERGKVLDSNYETLSVNLRTFIDKRVSAPVRKAPVMKHIDNKLQVLKEEEFYHSLKHAIAYHMESIEKPTLDDGKEPILLVLQQLMRVRSALEKLDPAHTTIDICSLYGQDLFKCPEPRCGSFSDGFLTRLERDRHCEKHQRIYLCSVPGCSSSMIGFSNTVSLQKHEENYHKVISSSTDFPWHGNLDGMDIIEEIKNGNEPAFELWLSQWTNFIPDDKFIQGRLKRINVLFVAAAYNQFNMYEKLFSKVKPGSSMLEEPDTLHSAILAGNEECFQKSLKTINPPDTSVFSLLTKALRLNKDSIAKILLHHTSSPMRDEKKEKRKMTYLNLTIRFDRIAVLDHILETYKVDATQQDDKSRTALNVAAEYDRIELAKHLISTTNCDKWATDKKYDTPYAVAGRQGHEKFISSIYSEDLSKDSVKEWLKVARFLNAARDGNDSRIREMVSDTSLRADEEDAQGRSPWIHAVENSHIRIVEQLLTRSDIMFLRSFKTGYVASFNTKPSALHIVAQSGNKPLIQILLHSGKFNGEIDRHCGYFGRGKIGKGGIGTPLGISKDCGYKEITEMMEKHKASLS